MCVGAVGVVGDSPGLLTTSERSMINRDNWKLTKAYIRYRVDVDRIGEASAAVERTYLRHLLEWADDVPFVRVKTIRPSLPEYVLSLDHGREGGRFSGVHAGKILSGARRFFEWAVSQYPEYRLLKGGWIATIKAKRLEELPKKVSSVSLDEIREIAVAPVVNIVEERIRAAAVFWFLSGIRIGAFVSLPIKAVDLSKRVVRQYPSLGVRTKNGKYGTTTLLDIPDLLRVVGGWDSKVHAVLGDAGYWFAPLSPDTGEFALDRSTVGKHRETLARRNLEDWLAKVGLPYRMPHAFRHGHIHYGLEHAETMADFKAVSLNVMHSNIQITDAVYSRLSAEEIHTRVERLGKVDVRQSGDIESEFKLFQQFLEWRKHNK